MRAKPPRPSNIAEEGSGMASPLNPTLSMKELDEGLVAPLKVMTKRPVAPSASVAALASTSTSV